MNTQIMDIQISETSKIYAESIAEEGVFYPAELEKEIGETAIHFKFIRLISLFYQAYFAFARGVFCFSK